jgi:acetylxylan esterase
VPLPHVLTSTLQNLTNSRAQRAWRSAAATAIALAGTACSVAGAGPAGAAAARTDCAAVRIISARADGEDPGPGVIGSLAKLIKGQLSVSVNREAVVYPAALNGWARSAAKGDKAIKALLTGAARRCPSQMFVLLGYSQGAEIVGDALGGGGGSGLGPLTAGVPAAVARKVVAVIQYSDPRRVPGLPFDKGSARGAIGMYPRVEEASLAGFAARIRSYCDRGDPICALGHNLAAHFGLTVKYNQTASRFVLRRLRAAGIT